MVGIYKITNNINNKIYIGQSVNILARWQQHKQANDNFPIHLAIRKYGIDNFSFEVIEECPQEELNEKEKQYIQFYHSLVTQGGYNISLGGEGNSYYSDIKIKELWDEGKSVGKICKEIDCHPSTIFRHLQNYENYSVEESISRGAKEGAQTESRKNGNHYSGLLSRKKTYKYSKNGDFLDEYESLNNAAESVGGNPNYLSKCISDIRIGYDFYWSYTKMAHFPVPLKKHGKQRDYVCLNTNEVFHSLRDGAKWAHACPSDISKCCKGEIQYAGKHPETKERLQWKFLETK